MVWNLLRLLFLLEIVFGDYWVVVVLGILGFDF
jgi:hypothetical protein